MPDVKHQSAEGALAELVTKAEYDIQIATAMRYPRSIKTFINDAMALVTLNENIASDCIYALPRGDKTIEGPSARFAEIILHAWGHSRAGARIVHEDSRFVTAQGVCHDLQSNTIITFEVRRRITSSSGSRYNEDMIGVTGNAACSIALRNAITRVVPKALWEPIYQEARKVVVGNSTTLANRRLSALQHLQKFGATQEMVLKKLGVKGIEDVTLDHLVVLRGIATALKEGDTTVEQLFSPEEKSSAKKEDSVIANINARIKGEAEQQPAPHDPETGEVTEAKAASVAIPKDAAGRPNWTQYKNAVVAALPAIDSAGALTAFQNDHAEALNALREAAPTLRQEVAIALMARSDELTASAKGDANVIGQ